MIISSVNKENSKKLGVYIHIPFCLKKCDYCGFLSFENSDEDLHKAYVEAVIREIEYYGGLCAGDAESNTEYRIDTVFIGGGTPSFISERLIQRLIESLRVNFSIDADAEISIESNPKTFSTEKLRSYIDTGINRLSMGAQALDDRGLKNLGRIHSSDDVFRAFETARRVGFSNINIDLMFGFHKHSMAAWVHTLKSVMELNPEHISFYSLQVEDDTEMYRKFIENKITLPDDDEDRELYHYAVEKFKDVGYIHYEISNCAMSGFECKHNMKYWNLDEYLGFGLGAHSYFSNRRFSNTQDLKKYLFELSEKGAYTYSEAPRFLESEHINSEFDNISEYLITGLRKTKGISLKDFKNRFGIELEEAYKDNIESLKHFQKEGFLILDEDSLYLTDKGLDVSNSILVEFV